MQEVGVLSMSIGKPVAVRHAAMLRALTDAPGGEIWMQKEDGRRRLSEKFAALLELEGEGLVEAHAGGRGSTVRWKITSQGREAAGSLAPGTGPQFAFGTGEPLV
jgi:hypothetical protein